MLRQRLTMGTRITLAAVVASVALATNALGQRAGSPPMPDQSVAELSGGEEALAFDQRNTAVAVTASQKLATVASVLKQIEAPTGAARSLKIKDPRQELRVTQVEKDNANKWHVRMVQVYKGIPVKDGTLAFHQSEASPNDEPVWNGTYQADPEVDITPKISRQQAIKIVESAVRALAGPEATATPEDAPNPALRVQDPSPSSSAVLEIHPGAGPGKRLLTYHVTVRNFTGVEPIILEAWVDNNGRIVEAYNNVQTACASNGTGMTFYQGRASYFGIAFFPSAGLFVANDNCLRIGTYDMYQTTTTTYQSSSTNTIFGNSTLANRNSTNADVHYGTVQTDSFLWYILGRDFVNGAGGPQVFQSVDGRGPLISARNHYGSRYNNAFWDGRMINVGDGDGSRFRSLSTLDIIGHEWVHGLTDFTARLQYLNESGALNESFSDVLGGVGVERYWKGENANTWKIGEGSFTPTKAGDALRYMDRPTKDGSSRDHYALRYIGTQDNGGVHWNSGIQNNAFYLMAKGGCHRIGGCMSGSIGTNAAIQIFWRALRYYLVSTSGFSAARQATLWAAQDLYGKYSVTWYRVQQAWNIVGVPRLID